MRFNPYYMLCVCARAVCTSVYRLSCPTLSTIKSPFFLFCRYRCCAVDSMRCIQQPMWMGSTKPHPLLIFSFAIILLCEWHRVSVFVCAFWMPSWAVISVWLTQHTSTRAHSVCCLFQKTRFIGHLLLKMLPKMVVLSPSRTLAHFHHPSEYTIFFSPSSSSSVFQVVFLFGLFHVFGNKHVPP